MTTHYDTGTSSKAQQVILRCESKTCFAQLNVLKMIGCKHRLFAACMTAAGFPKWPDDTLYNDTLSRVVLSTSRKGGRGGGGGGGGDTWTGCGAHRQRQGRVPIPIGFWVERRVGGWCGGSSSADVSASLANHACIVTEGYN